MSRVFTFAAVLIAITPVLAQQQRRPYERLFQLPGVTYSKEEQAKAEELRKKYAPQLADVQKKINGVYTDEQRKAERDALRKARADKKTPQEARRLAEAAAKLTKEQKTETAKLRQQQAALFRKIRQEVQALAAVSPTHADVKYGSHKRNVMDVWLAKSKKPTPVVVSIHGGGFVGGNKSVSVGLLRQCLDSGISVVAITYRFSSDAIAPASFHDGARAVQFIRHKAKEWNVDPKRIGATGGSAGAGISLWLGFHNDLADPKNDDPVLRESSRLSCMVVNAGQTSYDPRFIRKLFPDSDTYKHGALARLFGVDLDKLDDLPKEKYKLFEEVSAITHLTKDDPPAMLLYGGGLDQKVTNVSIGIHHAKFGKVLKDKMDALGIRCELYAGGRVIGNGERVSSIEFFKQGFGMPK